MTDWFDELQARRMRGVTGLRENDWERGIRQLSVDKYADATHFVFELLQNAEDKEATEARFLLKSDRLCFYHNGNANGERFSREDVENITGIGNTAKSQQQKIGRFGIGFKSVFVITNGPRIYTQLEGEPFAFAIEDLVVPVRLDDPKGLATQPGTLFSFPFRPGLAPSIVQRVEERLRTLGADTMLFLDHLTTVRWDIGEDNATLWCKRERSNSDHEPAPRTCVLRRQVTEKGVVTEGQPANYLVYAKTVEIEGADRPLTARIAFRQENEAIVTEKERQCAYVYFPTRELTGLKFLLHAPFLLNDSRANIRDDEPVNDRLMQACASLLAESLPDLRDRGLLTASALFCLPVRRQSFDGSKFRPLFDSVQQALKTQELLPTAAGCAKRHVRVDHAKISDSRPLRALLGQRQLTALYGSYASDTYCWLSEEIQKNVTRDLWAYLLELGVDEVDSEKFARRVRADFLEAQSDEWIIEFYRFLNDQPALWREKVGSSERGALRTRPIVRLEDENGRKRQVAPFSETGALNAYLPVGSDAGVQTVKRVICADEEALRFLKALGLRQPDVVDRVLRHVLPRYRSRDAVISDEDYAADITAIAEALDSSMGQERSELQRALKTHYFVRAVNAVGTGPKWRRASEVYRRTDELVKWFSGNPKAWFVSSKLDTHPKWSAINRFLERHGSCVAGHIRVSARGAHEGGHVELENEWGSHRRGLNGFDPDASIDGLEFALCGMTNDRARILWRLLLAQPYLVRGVVEKCPRQTFMGATSETYDSVLGKLCRERAWLPVGGGFSKPSDVRLSQLPEEFDRTSPAAHEISRALGMRAPVVDRVAAQLGVPSDVLDRFADLYNRNPESARAMLDRIPTADFPSSGAAYTERRAEKIAEEARNAGQKTYELRQRSVSVTSDTVRAEAKTYLRPQYTDGDGQVRCQICAGVMPFKLDTGEYYFEAVRCLRSVNEELRQNFLCLCPVCAAMYQHANSTAADSTVNAILNGTSPTLPLVLARERHTLQFNPMHFRDLQEALRATRNGQKAAV